MPKVSLRVLNVRLIFAAFLVAIAIATLGFMFPALRVSRLTFLLIIGCVWCVMVIRHVRTT